MNNLLLLWAKAGHAQVLVTDPESGNVSVRGLRLPKVRTFNLDADFSQEFPGFGDGKGINTG